ncbi:MAG: DUF1934 domain-containing protein [Lachnospiraceae bacterium]|nr:DUF1934 domain-containing protein [Lachnospiraceae bacterium]
MTKHVKVTIHSVQTQSGEKHEMHALHKGQYFFRGGYHYVLYEENEEGTSNVIRNRLKFSKQMLEVSKKGTYASQMRFESGKSHQTLYHTPFGKIPLGMTTRDYSLSEDQSDVLCVNLCYDMSADQGHLASCRMEIRIDGDT